MIIQMDLFTAQHETGTQGLVGELMAYSSLRKTPIPSRWREAKRNMDKYADYRTYLSLTCNS